MAEITLGIDGYMSPIMPLRNYELVVKEKFVKGAVEKVVCRIKACDVDEAMRIAQSLYPDSKIKYQGIVLDE